VGFYDRINAGDEVIVQAVPTPAPAAEPRESRTLLERLFGVRAAK